MPESTVPAPAVLTEERVRAILPLAAALPVTRDALIAQAAVTCRCGPC